jgi:hypothetical protein
MWEVDMKISEVRDHLDAESVTKMDNIRKAACVAHEASGELSRIYSKLNAISSFFVCENDGAEIRLENNDSCGFAFIIQDLAQEIKIIAERLEGGAESEQ